MTCHSTTVIYKTRVKSSNCKLTTLAYHRRILFTDFFSQSHRIVDRFQFASVTEAAKIKTEIERTRAEKAKAGKSEKQEKKPEKVQVQQEKQGQAEPEKD